MHVKIAHISAINYYQYWKLARVTINAKCYCLELLLKLMENLSLTLLKLHKKNNNRSFQRIFYSVIRIQKHISKHLNSFIKYKTIFITFSLGEYCHE